MPETLADLVRSTKLIVAPTAWVKNGRRLSLKLALEMEGVLEEDFFMRATALEEFPDQSVTFQLEYHGNRIPGGSGPLIRFEWRPLRPHNNKGVGPSQLRFVEIPGSHVHLFEDNWDEAHGAMRNGNMPIARPVPHDAATYADCLDMVGDLFAIQNIHAVSVPEWTSQLRLGTER